MRVDPKRPLVGFALVAVLCAVLMSLSVGRGWGTDVFGPGRPIAPPVTGDRLHHIPAPPATTVSIPADLSPQPPGVSSGPPVPAQEASLAREPVSAQARVSVPDARESGMKADRSAEKAAERVQRAADGASRKADRAADKAARKADRAADKAARKADRAADKAARKADRAADKAARKAERATERAARQAVRAADKAARTADRDAAKASRKR